MLRDVGEKKRARPAALGLSFAAGSAEDGTPYPPTGLREGIVEGDVGVAERTVQVVATLAAAGVKGIPTVLALGKDVVEGHLPKPILFAVGAEVGLVPSVLPLQVLSIGQPPLYSYGLYSYGLYGYGLYSYGLYSYGQVLRIGQLAVVGIPGEISTMAGRRLRAAVLSELEGSGICHAVLAGYANEYSQVWPM